MLVIAAIDLIGGRCVRLLKGNYDHRTEYSVDPVEQAIFLQKVGFSRVHIVDLDGARLGKPQNFPIISQVVSTLDLSVQVGGGIRKSADVASLASLGCFLILGSSALLEPEKVGSWIKQWGSDRFIISLDLDGKDLRTHGWKKSAPIKLLEALDLIGMWGIKQIICTDITRDGTLIGPNLSLLEEVVGLTASGTTVIAAGGVSRPEQIPELASVGIGGVVIGKALYESNIPEEEFANAG